MILVSLFHLLDVQRLLSLSQQTPLEVWLRDQEDHVCLDGVQYRSVAPFNLVLVVIIQLIIKVPVILVKDA